MFWTESCQEIKLDDESSQSKVYGIKPENTEIDVYCDLRTQNEGWIVSYISYQLHILLIIFDLF